MFLTLIVEWFEPGRSLNVFFFSDRGLKVEKVPSNGVSFHFIPPSKHILRIKNSMKSFFILGTCAMIWKNQTILKTLEQRFFFFTESSNQSAQVSTFVKLTFKIWIIIERVSFDWNWIFYFSSWCGFWLIQNWRRLV